MIFLILTILIFWVHYAPDLVYLWEKELVSLSLSSIQSEPCLFLFGSLKVPDIFFHQTFLVYNGNLQMQVVSLIGTISFICTVVIINKNTNDNVWPFNKICEIFYCFWICNMLNDESESALACRIWVSSSPSDELWCYSFFGITLDSFSTKTSLNQTHPTAYISYIK